MEDEATLQSELNSNGRATRVMRHKWLPDNLSRVITVHGIHTKTVDPQAFELSSLEPLTVTPRVLPLKDDEPMG